VLQRWITLREARRALKSGRLREALRLIREPHIREDREARDLREELLQQALVRAREALERNDLTGARDDLDLARDEGVEGPRLRGLESDLAERLRDREVSRSNERQTIEEARRLLRDGFPEAARSRLEALTEPTPEAKALLRTILSGLDDLGRYLEEVETARRAGDRAAARVALLKAETLYPQHAEVVRAAGALRSLEAGALRDEVLERFKAGEGEAALQRLRDAGAVGTEVQADPSVERAIEAFRARRLSRFREALTQGDPRAARAALESGAGLLSGAEDEALERALSAWERAEQAAALGEFARSRGALRGARATLPEAKALKGRESELAELEGERTRVLDRVGEDLVRGRLEAARDHLRAALSCSPSDRLLLDEARRVDELLIGRQTLAQNAREALRSGRAVEARDLALRRLAQGDDPDVRATLKEAGERIGRAQTLVGEAEESRSREGGPNGARRQVDEALRLAADLASARELDAELKDDEERNGRIQRMDALAAAGRFPEALAEVEALLEKAPSHPGARRRLPELRRSLGRHLLEEARRARRGPEIAPRLREAARLLTLAADPLAEEAERLLIGVRSAPGAGGGPLDEAVREVETLISAGRREEARGRLPALRALGAHDPRVSALADRLERPPSLVLRVDEGGQALIVPRDRVRIGNARTPGNDLPILASISSEHAELVREMSFHGGLRYRVKAFPAKDVAVNGRKVTEADLAPGDRIRLGEDLELSFDLPAPDSRTALLSLKEGFEVDGISRVLLLKGRGRDGRIRLGPGTDCHLRVASGRAEIYESSEGALFCSSPDGVQVDGGAPVPDARIGPGAMVRCGKLLFSLSHF